MSCCFVNSLNINELSLANFGIILISLLFFVVYIILSKRVLIKINNKAPNWSIFFVFTRRLSVFLIFLIILTISLENIGVKISALLSTPLILSEKYKITPYILILIIVIFFLTRAVTMALRSIFKNKVESNENYALFNVYKLVNYFVWILAVLLALNIIGIQLTILMAGSAALLVGVGIGMQQIFNDSISGLFLLFERSLKIQDIVEVENIVGKVKDIGIRTSRIITLDNIELIVPNSKLVSATVVNWTSNDKRIRFFLKIGVAYGTEPEIVRKTLIKIAQEHPLILKKPAPIVLFTDFADSSLNFELGFWTRKSFEHRIILSDLRFEVDKKFKELHINIPFPQHDIHIIK